MRKLLPVLSSTLQAGVRRGLLFLALLSSVSAIYASDTQVDDIWYDFDSSTKTASVTYRGSEYNSYSNEYSGSVVIPETVTYDGTTYSVTSIGDYAFCNCSSLTSVTIPESVTSIRDLAFYECTSLTSVTIPNSITSIGELAFYYCYSMTSVTIGESVTSIRFGAFHECTSLTSVTIPNSVTSIGDYAFDSCSSLTSVTIGNGVTSIGSYAFSGCSSLTKTNYTGDIAGWCNIKFSYTDANPISQSHNFYINDQEIKDLVIPESVTSIGGYAFSGCSSLTSVTIPNSVTSIGESAFSDCSSLTSVTIGESVTSIGDYAFYNCSSLTSVTIPNSVTSIGYAAFTYCSSLTSITCKAATPPTIIGNTYTFYDISTSIPVYVPCGCVEAYKVTYGWEDFTNIQEPLAEYSITVDVNDTIMGTAKVDYNTFCEGAQISATPNIGYHFVQWSDGNTDAIRTLELTQDTILTAEFAQSFSGQCGDSLYWELVDTTLHITGKGEMYNYKSNTAPWKLLVSSIKVLTIAEDVTKIGYDAFDGCTALVTIVWNAKHAADTYSDGQYVYLIFYEIRSQIKSFTFGENVEYIPTYLCAGMDKLTSITIPNSVTSIGNYTFQGCSSLTSINIPNSITSIGEGTFYGVNLEEIYCYPTTPPAVTAKNTFWNYNATLYVPCDSKEAYEEHPVFGEFKNIKGIDDCGGGFVTTHIHDTICQGEVYEFGEYICDTTGTYTAIIGDVTTFLYLTVLPSSIDIITIEVYDSYEWHGKVYTESGTYFYEEWCYQEILELTIIPSEDKEYVYGTYYQDLVCNQVIYVDPITGENHLISSLDPTSLTWSDTVKGTEVDTIHTFNITPIVCPEPLTEDMLYAIGAVPKLVAGEEVDLMGTTELIMAYYQMVDQHDIADVIGVEWVLGHDVVLDAEQTTHTMMLEVVTQCDDVILMEFTFPVSKKDSAPQDTTIYHPTVYETICEGTTFTWMGMDCTEAGLYEYHEIVEGEDYTYHHIYTLELTILPYKRVEYEMIAYDSYEWHGWVYTESGTHTYQSDECTIEVLYLTIIPSGHNQGEVVVEPSTNSVTITWQKEESADSYIIVIKQGDKVICTLIFDAEGNLVSVNYLPGRESNKHGIQHAGLTSDSFQYTITGLTPSTDYTYTVTAMDDSDNTISSYSGEFTTHHATSVENTNSPSPTIDCQKILYKDHIYILRDGKTYTIMGQEL